MAISTAIVWELRPTVGSDSACSGGFKTGASGTDWSQQNAAQYSLTGLTTAAANAIILTASASADMVGNIIQVTGGTNFTPGFYEITSVSVGVSITVDRNVTSAAGIAGTAVIGGALATIQQAVSVAVSGNVFWNKATGSNGFTSAMNLNFAAGTAGALPTTFIGYTTTRGDNGRVTWTTATNSINIVDLSTSQTAAAIVFQNIKFTNTAGTKGTGATGNAIIPTAANAFMVVVNNCLFDGFNVALGFDWQNVDFTVNPFYLFNSEIKNCVSHAVISTAGSACMGNYIHDNGGDGWRVISTTNSNAQIGQVLFLFNTFYNNTGIGINFLNAQANPQQYITVVNNNFANQGSDGIRLADGTQCMAFLNNIFWGNGGYGINMNATTSQPFTGLNYNNAYGTNTSGARHSFAAGTNDVAITVDPWTGRTSANFALNNTASGGAAVRAAAFPGVTANFGTGFLDIGALQSQASGGGTTIMSVRQTRYIQESR